MQFSKSANPSVLLGDDKRPENLRAAYLDTAAKCLTVTNGNALARVPVTVEHDDTPGWVTREAIDAARKAATKYVAPTILANGSLRVPLAHADLPRPSTDEMDVPNYASVWPIDDGSHEFRIGLSVALLVKICDALGVKGIGNEKGVEITFYSPTKAFLIEAVNADGDKVSAIQMPIKLQ